MVVKIGYFLLQEIFGGGLYGRVMGNSTLVSSRLLMRCEGAT
jgi:hypothetical protein